MKWTATTRTAMLRMLPLGLLFSLAAVLIAEDQVKRNGLDEPVYRVSTKEGPGSPPAVNAAGPPAGPEHVLDPALKIARECLTHIQKDVKDYSCTLVKRERVDGVLGDHQYIFTKVRNRKVENGQIVTPLSVYMYFLKPKGVEGREVIWVEGRNGGKLTAHEGGLLRRVVVDLDPESQMAMKDNRYPIFKVGVENLVSELIMKGERDRKRNECEVQFIKGAKINDRVCTCLQVTHPVRRAYFDFNIARIFIDDEMHIPVRYEAYEWPAKAGESPVLLEEYTYLNLKLNVDLTDNDFSRQNPKLNFR